MEQEAVKQERRGGILSRLPFRPSGDGDGTHLDSFEALARVVKARNSKADLRDLQHAFAFADKLLGEDTYYAKADTSLPERQRRAWERKPDLVGAEG